MPLAPGGTIQGPPDEQLEPFEPVLERPVSRRFLLFKGGVVAAFGLLAVRLWQMQIADGRQYAAQAESNRVDVQPLPAPRGVIYDRNGIVLAGNKANWSIIIVPARLPREPADERALYAELDRLLAPPWVLAVLPRRLPIGAEREVLGQVAATLGRPLEAVVAAVEQAVAADQTPVLADDIPSAVAPAMRAALTDLPGVMLVSRPEYLVWASPTDARLPVVVQQGVARDLALSIESRGLLLPGVGIQPEPGRAYPSGPIAAQVVGYVGRVDPETRRAVLTPTGQPVYDLNDTLGQAGMEARLESLLRGRKGSHVVEVDSNRRIMRELSNQPPTPGANVALTLDLAVQKEATDALNQQLAAAGLAAGTAVALDPSTGEVLALVSVPTFNSQEFSDGLSARAYQALLNDPNQPLFNRCLGGLYAPGACLTPFVALTALREGIITPETVHVCRGGIHIPKEFNEITRDPFRCWQATGHGPLSVAGALAQACHVFFYNAVMPAAEDARGKPLRYYEAAIGGTPIEFKGLGVDRLNAGLRAFGFERAPGSDLGAEEMGLLPSPAWKRERPGSGAWTLGDTLNSGLGLGDVQVTPLQMAVATAALANGGVLYRPRMLKSILRDGNQTIEEQASTIVGRVEGERAHFDAVRQGLRQAVSQGAAGRVTVPGMAVAGQAGTRMPAVEGADPALPRPHAWFIGFAPADQPRIAVAVMLERGGDGAALATPVAERMFQAFFRRW